MKRVGLRFFGIGACALFAVAGCGDDAARGETLKKVLYSQAALDGMVSDQDYFTATNAMETAGDNASDSGMRVVLVFDIGELPANALIVSASLSAFQGDTSYGAAFPSAEMNLGNVFVDHVTNCADPGDYYGTEPLDVNIGVLATNFVAGSRHALDVTIALQDDLTRKSGWSCYRLYHETGNDNDATADCETWVMGEAVTNRPTLTVNYTLP